MSNHEDSTTPLEKYLTNEFCKIWHVLAAADAELQAYKDGLQECLSDNPNMAKDLESCISRHRQSRVLQKTMREKHDPILRHILNGLPERAPHTDSVVLALEALED